MASNPQLPYHLIREFTNIVRLCGDGDAMVRLALSGKEPLSVFEYVVNTHVYLRLDDEYNILNLEAFDFFKLPRSSFKDSLTVSTEGAQRLFCRFVRDLNLSMSVGLRMPIDWTNLFSLSISEVSDSFVADVVNGTISLTNLQSLTLHPTFDQYLKLLSTTSCLSLPKNVSFSIRIKDDTLIDHSTFQTFPKVKRFYVRFDYETAITVELLHHFSTVVKCFPNVETANLVLYCEHNFTTQSFAGIVSAKEQLCNLSFSVPVDINYNENVVYYCPQTPECIYDRLESTGFESFFNRNGQLNKFEFETNYDNVKLKHNLFFVCKSYGSQFYT